jgi:hypothetical protein
LIFDLPWPEERLIELGESPVELRVTLSYFAEPNPKKTLRVYEGGGLKWDLQKATESTKAFIGRVNIAEREEKSEGELRSVDDWKIGITTRRRGTVQSDRWYGTAAELATRHKLAVYPTVGWWRENPTKYPKQEIPFSLIVSIISEDVNIDLYNLIKVNILTPVEV